MSDKWKDDLAAISAALDAKDARIKELEGALRAIIEQWDTPNWKLTEHTGTIIARAREALNASEGRG